jgi:hypothetical protein
MKGDFSRIAFDPTQHYVGVLHQQGRVWLDSDWNQDVQARLALVQQELADVIGPSGVPAPGTAFQISASTGADPSDFQIAAGHCYVGGMLCVLDNNASYLSQPDLPEPPSLPIPSDGSTLTALIYLEVWERLITYLEQPSLREVALGGPDTSARLKTVAQVKVQTLPAGTGPMTGAEAAQFLPTPGAGTLTTVQPATTQPQTLCQLPDSANYTGRQNSLYRVEVHNRGDVAGSSLGSAWSDTLAADAASGATSLVLATALTAAQIQTALNAGFLTVSDSTGTSERVQVFSVAADSVTLQVSALINRYTVANAAAVAGGVARFKWSSENASFGVTVTAVQPDRQTLTLDSLGRDTTTALAQGDLVEITDDASDLGRGHGLLTYLKSDPDPDLFTVVLTDPLPASFGTGQLILRRWDGLGDVTSNNASPALNFGNGVQIEFGGQDLHPGDYWQFATRVADGSVESLVNAPPAGIKRAWSPLAIVTWGPPPPTSPPSSPPSGVAFTVLSDCRSVFPPLIDFPQPDRGFHIIGLSLVTSTTAADGTVTTSSTPLGNDTNIEVTAFSGIDIQCDAAVDPASLARPACGVFFDYPLNLGGTQGPTAYFQTALAGTLSTVNGVISWRLMAGAQSFLSELVLADQTERGVLSQLRVRGNFIWSLNDPTLFLDGDAFGLVQSGVNGVSINLPSGDKRRGGDFEMWFWLVAAPPSVTGLALDQPGTFLVGASANLVISLSSPALSNCVLLISFSNAGVTSNPAAVPSSPPTSPPSFDVSLPVAVGATSASLPVTGQAIGQTNATAQMTQNGANIGSAAATTLTVSQLAFTGVLGISPATILIGGAATASFTLSGPAPASGQPIQVASSATGVATVPATVTVAGGSTTASFTVTGVAAGQATIAVILNNASLSSIISVQAKGKETKEIKDAEKVVKDIDRKITDTKSTVLEQVKKPVLVRGAAPLLDGTHSTAMLFHTVAGTQKAFIPATERPEVEEAVLKLADRLSL